MEKQRVYKSIWILLGLILMSLPEIAVSIQTIKSAPEMPTIWLCLFLGVVGIAVLSLRHKMFPVKEAGF